jgi:hypothetical protein
MIRYDILTQKRYESDLIRPKIETQSQRYEFDPKLNMWCDYDPSNKGIKFELIPSWFGPIFPCLVFCGRNQQTSLWTIFFLFGFFFMLLIYFGQ